MKLSIFNYFTLLQLTLASPQFQRRQANPSKIPDLAGGSCMLYAGVLWYLGGYTTPRSSSSTYSNKLLSLSLSTDFNMTAPPWGYYDLGGDNRFQYSPSAATDSNNGFFYIFGAYGKSDSVSLQPTAGDNKVYKFDTSSKIILPISNNQNSNNPQWRYQHTLDYYSDTNQLILHGGQFFNSQNNVLTTSNSTYLFDIGSDSWSLISQEGPTVYNHYSFIYKNQLYVLGGIDGRGILSTLETIYVMDLKTKTWSTKLTNGPPPLSAIGMSFGVVGSTVAAFGGYANTQGQFSNSLLVGGTLNLDNLSWNIVKTADLQSASQRAYMCVVTTPHNNLIVTQGEVQSSSSSSSSIPTAQLWDPTSWLLIDKNIPIANTASNPVNSKLGIILMGVLIPLAFIFITWLTCYCYKKSQSSKSKAYTVNEPVWTDPYEKNNTNSNTNDNLSLERDLHNDKEDPMNLDTDLFTNPDTVLSASQSQMNILPVNGRRSYYE